MRFEVAAQEYTVLARARRGEPLLRIGSVFAPTPRLAAIYARHTYDERTWEELFTVPSAGWNAVPPVRS